MGVRILPLASSSKANCYVVHAGPQVVVIDAGIPRREILSRLIDEGVLTADKPKPDLLLLTHEHSDHSRFMTQWIGRGAPMLMTVGTAMRLKLGAIAMEGLETHRAATWVRALPWEPLNINDDVIVTPIQVPHDAAEPVAWRVTHAKETAIVATDLARLPYGWDLFVRGATEILLEANYHPDLLRKCHYIEPVKQRIAGPLGHMNVNDVCTWIAEKLPGTVRRLWLGHISREANDPKIVRHLATLALSKRPDVELIVLEK